MLSTQNMIVMQLIPIKTPLTPFTITRRVIKHRSPAVIAQISAGTFGTSPILSMHSCIIGGAIGTAGTAIAVPLLGGILHTVLA